MLPLDATHACYPCMLPLDVIFLLMLYCSLRFVLRAVHPEGVAPISAVQELTPQVHYRLAQGRALACLELWAICRGDDLRGQLTSVAKLFGSYVQGGIVGPDPFYKMQVLKDDAKANKVGRPELIGTTRHKDPEVCSINAVATMLLLRFGKEGMIGALPDFFDMYCNWTEENALFTRADGTGAMEYEEQRLIFQDMKTAAGLQNMMADSATKLRSFGAMHANEFQASHPEIERFGR